MSTSYDQFLSATGRRLRESAIRRMGALMAGASDLVSFAPGYPAEELFPWDAFEDIARSLLSSNDGKVLQYGATRGYRPLIEVLVGLMAERGVTTTDAQIVVTTGSQQGLDLLARVLLDEGDVLLVERPSYVGAISAFQNTGAELVGVAQDHDGLIIDALDEEWRRLTSAGRRVKALYTVPNFQNPTGLLVSLEKRRALVDWATRRDLLIIEDDPYRDLYFEDVTRADETRPIAADDTEGRVIYLSSFSKTLAPAFRTAWISAPRPIADRLELAKQSADLCTGVFDQRVINAACRQGLLAAQLPRLREAYRAKRDAMALALRRTLGGALAWDLPRGGFFLWTQLPAGIDGNALLPIAHRRGVIYVTGESFFADGSGRDYVRLAFSSPSLERIDVGVRRLAEALSEAAATPAAAQ